MHLFLAITTLLSSASALGINCRGSGACNFNDASLDTVLTQAKQLQANGQGGHNWAEHVQIACSKGQWGSVCAFFQSGASGTTDRVVELLQGLKDHKCTQCGSIPTQDGNNVDDGQLTVNYVENPCCQGDCYCPV
ncbi:Killer toxin, Kp4/SMK-like, core [Fusarium austroafricanum]|uniref:Killer toxin, Kp4/SMK-like, core n=1 Tax=Fusarium austroafricanum TaxID=2364996 RepID=A0A8H4P1V6_9HYPO|nr:Killer toxin, Kp4/SMK-like, core [Fusarium austroafricanum]